MFDQPVRDLSSNASASAVTPGSAAMNATGHSEGTSLSDIAFQSEAQAILHALDANDGHRARTARTLGISERTLRYRLASMRESGLIGARAAIAGGEA